MKYDLPKYTFRKWLVISLFLSTPVWAISTSSSIPVSPTDNEIFRARIFEEPLIPMRNVECGVRKKEELETRNQKQETPSQEPETRNSKNRDLAQALLTYSKRNSNDDISAITNFLEAYPESRWRVALLTNLGIVYRKTGYFSKALDAWEEAWKTGKSETEPKIKALVDRAVSELAELNSRLGRNQRLKDLLLEIEGRDIRGSATEKITGAREGRWMMQHVPEESYKCGPFALAMIQISRGLADQTKPLFFDSKSTLQGISLDQVAALANQTKMDLQMAKRISTNAEIPLPCVVHWKVGHYAALIKKENGRYWVQDPTFGDDLWISQKALDAETTGYFLVPQGALPFGWKSIENQEAKLVWGRGTNTSSNPDNFTPQDRQTCPIPEAPMAQHNIHLALVSLHIVDTPVGYAPPRGYPVKFQVSYNQREVFQPANFNYSNLGPKWTFNWLSYINDNGTNATASVFRYVSGGGRRESKNFNSNTQTYAPEQNGSFIVRLNENAYERRLPYGSKEVFDLLDGTPVGSRKVFLTKMIDPYGNTLSLHYDQDFRLTSIVDALNQTSALEYVSNVSSEIPQFYLIKKVTDPFGRFAKFEYNSVGQLSKITDIIGITSEFSYVAGDFINALTTPYGVTRFTRGETPDGTQTHFRFLEVTNPLGQKERVEMRRGTGGYGVDEPQAPPGSSTAAPELLRYRNTFYWDRKAMANAPGDYTKARSFHWCHDLAPSSVSGTVESEKEPLENRVWYRYPGQIASNVIGTSNFLDNASLAARTLDDGTTQVYAQEYNSLGKLTKSIDPLGRATSFVYATNQIDLLEVRQTTGTNNELLTKFSYNTQHLPLTIVDASGQGHSLAYNSQGQLTSVTNPKNETTTLVYNSSGYLQSITGPIPGSTTVFTHDGFGRIRTMSDSEGYTITTDFDALDRVTKITYPDTTFNQMIYHRLDPDTVQDRLGRATRNFYNSIQQLVSIQDALNRVTKLEWCNCGSLEKIIDPLNHATTWFRDLQGRVTDKAFENGKMISYVYEKTTSRLKSVKDSKNQFTIYNYLLDNNLSQISYSNAVVATPSVSFTYEPNYNRIATMTDGIGTTIYSYHPIPQSPSPPVMGAGRLASIDGPLGNDTISWNYDELGRVISRSINGVPSSAAYDSLGRIASSTNSLGGFTYQYLNQTTRLSSMTYPNGQTTTFSYFDNNGDQRLKQIWNKNASSATISKFDYEYNAEGQITKWTLEGFSQPKQYTFKYDSMDQLVEAKLALANSPFTILNSQFFTYDKAGNRISEQIDNGITKSIYSNVNELSSQEGGGPLKFEGILTEPSKVTVGGIPAIVRTNNTFEATVNVSPGTNVVSVVAQDRTGNLNTTTNNYQVVVVSGGESKTCQWDANGCLTEIRTPQLLKQFEWDARNLLVKRTVTDLANPTNPVKTTEVVRDGLGRFVRITEKEGSVVVNDMRLVWGGFKIVEARDANGTNVLIRFFDLGMEIVNGPNAGIYFYTFDHLGSVREVIRATTGQVVVRNEYDSWGQLTRVMGTLPLSFAFQGMYDFGDNTYLTLYRPYFAELAKWGSPDPLGEQADLDLTRFVGNDPINGVDPLGLVVFFVHGTWSSSGNAFDRNFVHHVMEHYNDQNAQFLKWSGKNKDVDRRTAARELARQIEQYHQCHPDDPIRVVGHSHGGNVALIASNTQDMNINELVTLGTPILSGYQPGNIANWNNVFSKDDWVQTNVPGAVATHSKANNIQITGFGHTELPTVPAWDAAFPLNRNH